MSDYGYGLWAAVVFESVFFIIVALDCFRPRSKRDWRAPYRQRG